MLWLLSARQSISYRGCFATRQEAAAAIRPEAVSQYDIVNKKKAENVQQEEQKLDSYFKDADYPLFFWLSRCLAEECRVLELGGSLGHCYYTSQRFQMLPPQVRWVVAELPEAVALGKQLAEKRKQKALSFITSDSQSLAGTGPADIFVSAGTLQYMEQELWQILDGLAGLPQQVLVHHLPVHRDRDFWTLQKLELCEVPYHVYSRRALLREMESRGYQLIKEWHYPRYIEIPFHRSATAIQGYQGYYFSLAAADKAATQG